MKREFKVLCILVVCAAICVILPFFSGCAIITAVKLDSDPNALLTPNLTPSPTISDDNEYFDELYGVFYNNFDTSLFMINDWSLKYGYDYAQTMSLNIPRCILKADNLKLSIDFALDAVYQHAQELFPSIKKDFLIDYPSFQFLATTLPFINSKDDFLALLNIGLDISEKDNILMASVSSCSIADFAHKYSGGSSEQYINIRFTYAYLSATYDSLGNEITDCSFEFPQDQVNTLVFPLRSRDYNFSDTWCATRSNNTRKHMGTDIKADEGTEILSTSSGIVTAVGFSKIPGNFVIVTDSFGYEYHYYHLVEPTTYVKVGDTVASGDVIGNVGNTGNSDANHLHISIIADDVFINPYSLMQYLKSR